MNLIEDEYWDKPYKCRTCDMRFENIQDQQRHVKEHLPHGICPLCKKYKILEDHHYSYKDFGIDKKANTVKLCHSCHGYQTIVQKEIRSGIPQIYIGHNMS